MANASVELRMNKSNLVTVIIVIASAIIPYLLIEKDVPLPPIGIVILTAANIGLTAYARLSGTTAVPVAEVGTPAQTPAGDTATVTATTPKP